MQAYKTKIEGLLILEPKIFADDRGYFFESYNQKTLADLGIVTTFVQDNQSKSTYGVIRGLHFQKGNDAQAKLVRVISGTVLDVAVDLRPTSPTFGEYVSAELSAENKKQFFIPRGFAHGFAVLSEEAVFAYKCDNYYCKQSDGGLLYSDADLNIDWKIPENLRILSDKDKNLPTLKELGKCF
jgi:dTDP-4-dehydrorhamnose 3,5-epimerase